MRRMYPRFQPNVFDENMKLVEEIRKIAQRKNCTVSFCYIPNVSKYLAKHDNRWPKLLSGG